MRLSFIIPSFNSVTWLPHAVTSALEQTIPVEVVVVDDGSTDKTGEYLDWLKKDSRVKVIRNQKNVGRSEARNIGNKAAQGDILCVLDADDIATPNRAALTLNKFKNSPVDLAYGPATIIDAIGKPQARLTADVFDLKKATEKLHNGIVHSTVAYRKELAERFPYRSGEIAKLGIDDWAMQVEAAMSGCVFDYIPQLLGCYRVLESQVTQTRNKEAVKTAKLAFLESLKVPA